MGISKKEIAEIEYNIYKLTLYGHKERADKVEKYLKKLIRGDM